jgi:hypothetical protein
MSNSYLVHFGIEHMTNVMRIMRENRTGSAIRNRRNLQLCFSCACTFEEYICVGAINSVISSCAAFEALVGSSWLGARSEEYS